MMKKIVFLDRDDILIVDTGYPHKVNELIFKPEILPLLKFLKSNGYEFIVVTNQSGIGRGYYTEDDYENCKKAINHFYQQHGIDFLDWFYSPYHVDGLGEYKKDSECRKPNPGMIHQACEKFDIDIPASMMIGDKESDRIRMPELRSFIISSGDHSDFKSFDELLEFLKSS